MRVVVLTPPSYWMNVDIFAAILNLSGEQAVVQGSMKRDERVGRPWTWRELRAFLSNVLCVFAT